MKSSRLMSWSGSSCCVDAAPSASVKRYVGVLL